jgi:hypothetical protein
MTIRGHVRAARGIASRIRSRPVAVHSVRLSSECTAHSHELFVGPLIPERVLSLKLLDWPAPKLANTQCQPRRAAHACRAVDDDLIDVLPAIDELDRAPRVFGTEEDVARPM